MAVLERERVRDRAWAIHRSGGRRDRDGDRPQAELVDDRRHIGCALHHKLLPSRRIRPRRRDDAPSGRARTTRRLTRTDWDLSQDPGALFQLSRFTVRTLLPTFSMRAIACRNGSRATIM